MGTVFVTHAHFDHFGNVDAFPNAHFYIARQEIERSVWALLAESGDAETEPARPARRVWPAVLLLLVLAIAGGAGWALHAGLIRL